MEAGGADMKPYEWLQVGFLLGPTQLSPQPSELGARQVASLQGCQPPLGSRYMHTQAHACGQEFNTGGDQLLSSCPLPQCPE